MRTLQHVALFTIVVFLAAIGTAMGQTFQGGLRGAVKDAQGVPTVQATDNTHWNRMQDQSGVSTMSIGGGGTQSNNYLLDGFPVTDLSNRSSTNPSAELFAHLPAHRAVFVLGARWSGRSGRWVGWSVG